MLVIPQTPASVILKEASLINITVSLEEVLNSAASFENEPSRSEVSNSILQEMFDSRVQSTEEAINDSQETQDLNSVVTVSHVIQYLSEIPDQLDDPDLLRALAAVMSCVTNLKKNGSD